MNVVVVNNYDRMSDEVAKLVRNQITEKPASVLGLPTGSTPLGSLSAASGDGRKGPGLQWAHNL